jgi:hypothetical protein
MNTFAFVALIFLVLILLSIVCHYLMMLTGKFWQGLMIAIFYFVLIFLVFDRASALTRFLVKRQIYIELGHADEVLLLPFVCWLLIGFVNVMIVVRKKQKTKISA